MKTPDIIPGRIYDFDRLRYKVAQLKTMGKSVAFTNGCFDILHRGHIYSLSQAAKEADFLVVAVNADVSVKKLKGEGRPVNDQESRALVLASLIMVDAVIVFEEDTPLELIKTILPDVLVKGGDYTAAQIAGANEVIANGGRVKIVPLIKGISTTDLIKNIRNA
jgi:D-glycero-beta-D-manno-heptose 1-phosphate adenylyltransferase